MNMNFLHSLRIGSEREQIQLSSVLSLLYCIFYMCTIIISNIYYTKDIQ